MHPTAYSRSALAAQRSHASAIAHPPTRLPMSRSWKGRDYSIMRSKAPSEASSIVPPPHFHRAMGPSPSTPSILLRPRALPSLRVEHSYATFKGKTKEEREPPSAPGSKQAAPYNVTDETPHFADPTYDIAFKKLFGDQNNQQKLISFLNSTLDRQGANRIVKVTFRDPHRQPANEDGKLSIVDLYATDQSGHHFVVEIQISKQPLFSKRALFYASSIYSQQLKKSSHFDELNAVFFIGVLDFKIPNEELTNYLSHYKMHDSKKKISLDHGIELIFVELPKFEKELTNDMTLLEKWIYLLKHAPEMKVVPEEFKQHPELKDALEALAMHKWTSEEKFAYLRYDMALGAQEDARRGAIAEGRAEGRAAGLAEGLAEGRAEAEAKVKKIALNLLTQNWSITKIADATGLSEKEVLDLKQKVE